LGLGTVSRVDTVDRNSGGQKKRSDDGRERGPSQSEKKETKLTLKKGGRRCQRKKKEKGKGHIFYQENPEKDTGAELNPRGGVQEQADQSGGGDTSRPPYCEAEINNKKEGGNRQR